MAKIIPINATSALEAKTVLDDFLARNGRKGTGTIVVGSEPKRAESLVAITTKGSDRCYLVETTIERI